MFPGWIGPPALPCRLSALPAHLLAWALLGYQLADVLSSRSGQMGPETRSHWGWDCDSIACLNGTGRGHSSKLTVFLQGPGATLCLRWGYGLILLPRYRRRTLHSWFCLWGDQFLTTPLLAGALLSYTASPKPFWSVGARSHAHTSRCGYDLAPLPDGGQASL